MNPTWSLPNPQPVVLFIYLVVARPPGAHTASMGDHLGTVPSYLNIIHCSPPIPETMYPIAKPPSIIARVALIAMSRGSVPVPPSSAAAADASPSTDELKSAREEQPDDACDVAPRPGSATPSSCSSLVSGVVGEDEGDGADNDSHFPCTIHGAALERRLFARLVDDAVARLLPQLNDAADAAVARRFGEAQSPPQPLRGDEDDNMMTASAEEGGSAVSRAVRALAALEVADRPAHGGLAERVFVRQGVVTLLRRLLGRLEGELADLEWEQL